MKLGLAASTLTTLLQRFRTLRDEADDDRLPSLADPFQPPAATTVDIDLDELIDMVDLTLPLTLEPVTRLGDLGEPTTPGRLNESLSWRTQPGVRFVGGR